MSVDWFLINLVQTHCLNAKELYLATFYCYFGHMGFTYYRLLIQLC